MIVVFMLVKFSYGYNGICSFSCNPEQNHSYRCNYNQKYSCTYNYHKQIFAIVLVTFGIVTVVILFLLSLLKVIIVASFMAFMVIVRIATTSIVSLRWSLMF